jgi:DNA-binding CsgD family transcriptional regulator
MAGHHTKDSFKGSQLLSELDINSFQTIWGSLPDPLCVKDTDGKFIYANAAYLEFIGLPSDTIVAGYTEDTLVSKSVFAPGDDFNFGKALSRRRHLKKDFIVRESARSKYGSYSFFQFERNPVLVNNALAAFFIYGRREFIFSLNEFYNLKSPSSVKTIAPSDFFTDREWDVIFFLQQNYSRNEIGEVLGMSPVTVKNHIGHAYKKAGVKNSKDFFNFCSKRDELNYIPIRSTVRRKEEK